MRSPFDKLSGTAYATQSDSLGSWSWAIHVTRMLLWTGAAVAQNPHQTIEQLLPLAIGYLIQILDHRHRSRSVRPAMASKPPYTFVCTADGISRRCVFRHGAPPAAAASVATSPVQTLLNTVGRTQGRHSRSHHL
jgi:hypothetical protein